MAEQPSGTVSFFFSDIEGSTRLLAELGRERYAQVLREHHRLLRAAFTRHQGYEVDCEGDAFFVAFQSAESAVRAAAEVQWALAAHDWPEGLELRVRIGVHTGEALLEPPNYVGMDVHRAARIMAAGHGGQVLLSQTTRDLVDAAVRDLGEHRLKDLSEPQRLYQLGEGEFPSLKTLYQTNLPVPATPFLGRERELAEVGALLERDDLRLLALTGPGGTGKTRLGLQAAGAAAERYRDGIWWVSLAALGDPSLVLATVAQVLGAKRELAEHIGAKRLLLLMDNFEHLIDAAAALGAVLAACPNITVLVTSRERLQLAGEHEYAVPPLAPPDGVALFLARARALGAAFDENGAVRELCDRLDNLPLALELAAARTKLFSPTQLVDRLGQRLDLFKGGRDADPRQRTLRATIEWSYDLLTPAEQALFARLSVFAGGCTFDAAREICDADEDLLQSLLDKSLLRHRAEPDAEPRFWMLETIRQFALERLHRDGDERELRRRHGAFFRRFVERVVADPARVPTATLELLDLERENLRAALGHARATGDGSTLAAIASRLWLYWRFRGAYSEGLGWLDEVWARGNAGAAEQRAAILAGLSNLALRAGDMPAAASWAERELAAAREARSPSAEALALRDLGNAAVATGDLERAVDFYEQSGRVARGAGDTVNDLGAAVNTALVDLSRGRADRALPHAEHAAALAATMDTPEPEIVAISRYALSFAYFLLGRLADAEQGFLDALKVGVDHDWPEASLYALVALGCVRAAAGRPAEAARVLGAASALQERHGLVVTALEIQHRERALAHARGALGEEEFQAAFAAGAALSMSDAAAEAFVTSGTPPRAT